MKEKNNASALRPAGRIDSLSAGEFERAINNALERSENAALTIDFDRVEFISSAGFRVLLRAVRRPGVSITVKNVSRELYELFDMTGFVSLLNVERKLRDIDVSGCEVIGTGATSTVYRIDPDTIVKVYETPDALETIKKEQSRAKHAFLMGIPTAISYDAVRVGERYGAVFELLNAKTFVDILNSEPDRLDELVRMHAELIKTIHGIEAAPGELPDCRRVFTDHLNAIGSDIPADLGGRLRELLSAMPEDRHLIHGDIHMKNVMLCGGEPTLIDMETLSTGNPVFDLGDLFIAYCAFNEDDPGNSQRIIGIPREVCAELFEKTLALLLEGSDEALLSQQKKRVMTIGWLRFLYLVAVLGMGGEELRSIRIKHAAEHLYELTREVDGLTV